MVTTLTNTIRNEYSFNNNSGLIEKRMRIGSETYIVMLNYNNVDDHWYITIPNLISGRRILHDRIIYSNREGFLIAEGPVDKTNFTQLIWYDFTI